MPDKLIIHRSNGTKVEVAPLKLWTPGDFFEEQEDFFEAVRADAEMTDEQKEKWLALESKHD